MSNTGNGKPMTRREKFKADRLAKAEAQRAKEQQVEKCGTAASAPRQAGYLDGPELSNRNEPQWARHYVANNHHSTEHGMDTLWCYNQGVYAWTGTHYKKFTHDEIFGRVGEHLDKCDRILKDGTIAPFAPKTTEIAATVKQFLTTNRIPQDLQGTFYIDNPDRDATGHIACQNKIINVKENKAYPLTPNFFSTMSLPFHYDPDATCPKWQAFLDDLWPDDPQSQETLQEMFGEILSGDRTRHKVFLVVGPTRAGKGVMTKVLEAMCGKGNFCATTLRDLAGDFGLETFPEKMVAVVPDARFSESRNSETVVEKVLSIAASDTISIKRKYKIAIDVKLMSRIMIFTNEVPELKDSSGAAAVRFVILQLRKSFVGQTKLGLEKTFMDELPGIFNWAMAGYQRLVKRGDFVEPEASSTARELLASGGSPIKTFLEERCEIVDDGCVEVGVLFANWKEWCESGNQKPGTKAEFGRMIHAAAPMVQKKRTRIGDDLKNAYHGLKLA